MHWLFQVLNVGHALQVRQSTAWPDLNLLESQMDPLSKIADMHRVAQALTMLLAGFETTANTLSFTLYLLARPCNAEKQVLCFHQLRCTSPVKPPCKSPVNALKALKAYQHLMRGSLSR